MITYMVLSFLGAILMAVALESILSVIERHRSLLLPRHEVILLAWPLLGILCVLSGVTGMATAFIMLPVAIAHTNLTRHTSSPVSLADLFRELGSLTKAAACWLWARMESVSQHLGGAT